MGDVPPNSANFLEYSIPLRPGGYSLKDRFGDWGFYSIVYVINYSPHELRNPFDNLTQSYKTIWQRQSVFESAAPSFKLLRNESDTEFLGGGRGETPGDFEFNIWHTRRKTDTAII